jgi:hypothetical protein
MGLDSGRGRSTSAWLRYSAIICLAGLCVGCAQRSTPIAPGTDTFYFGHLTRGAKFGVRVGESAELARQQLASNRTLYVGPNCDFAASQIVRCVAASAIATYAFSGPLRRGTLVLELDGNRVRGIAWSFYLPFGG